MASFRRALSRGKRSDAPPGPLKPGQVIAAKYRIEGAIGEGGMGTVFAAHHLLLDQRVAIKVLFRDGRMDGDTIERFLFEARAAARLQSEHVARVMDVDTLPGGTPFIVMEHLEGMDLACALATHGPVHPTHLVDCMLQALDALAQAHALGIVHRDLKPSNLFLASRPDGSPVLKILDFGISKVTLDATIKRKTLTRNRSVLGSPPYMSPEQLRTPRAVDVRTDIWSLGVCMYELLSGRMPFEGDEVGELFAAILETTPPPLRALRPEVPPGLDEVIARCLTRDRDRRFADVAELARALSPFAGAPHEQAVERVAQTLKRRETLSQSRRGSSPSFTPFPAIDAWTPPDEARTRVRRSGVQGTVLEASGPELSGTASTVGRRRATWVVSPRAPWMLAAGAATVSFFMAGCVLLGILSLRAQTTARSKAHAVVEGQPVAAAPAPLEAVNALPEPTSGASAPIAQVPETRPAMPPASAASPQVASPAPAPVSRASSARGHARPAAPLPSALNGRK